MLKKLTVKGFKSLEDVAVEFPRMAVLFGPNAAGKSNLLDAVQALSRIGTSRTLSDALSEPIRGYPIEAFAFPAGGLAALLSQTTASFSRDGFRCRQRTLSVQLSTYGRDPARFRQLECAGRISRYAGQTR